MFDDDLSVDREVCAREHFGDRAYLLGLLLPDDDDIASHLEPPVGDDLEDSNLIAGIALRARTARERINVLLKNAQPERVDALRSLALIAQGSAHEETAADAYAHMAGAVDLCNRVRVTGCVATCIALECEASRHVERSLAATAELMDIILREIRLCPVEGRDAIRPIAHAVGAIYVNAEVQRGVARALDEVAEHRDWHGRGDQHKHSRGHEHRPLVVRRQSQRRGRVLSTRSRRRTAARGSPSGSSSAKSDSADPARRRRRRLLVELARDGRSRLRVALAVALVALGRQLSDGRSAW